jgi:hypothetical protein
MPILQLLILALVAMACLAAIRVLRVRSGRTPVPDGLGWLVSMAGFAVAPPLVVGAVARPSDAGWFLGITFLPIYFAIFLGLAIVMSVAAAIVGEVAHGRVARLARLALAGTEVDPDDRPANVPLTKPLAANLAGVDLANGAFPRGPEFPKQVDLAGFRGRWDDLEAATKALEKGIADDTRLGLGVATVADATAEDARSRLNMLRRIAGDHGQAWATT